MRIVAWFIFLMFAPVCRRPDIPTPPSALDVAGQHDHKAGASLSSEPLTARQPLPDGRGSDRSVETDRSDHGSGASSSLKADPPSKQRKLFTDITSEAGFHHRHHKPVLDHKLDNIMSWVASIGAAVAAADYDKDGWIDLYVTNSCKGKPNYLYRNNGDPAAPGFTDVAVAAGVANVNDDRGVSTDCKWGDVDNDGWPDLYVAQWGENRLFRNNRDGTFTDVTTKSFRKRDGSPGSQWANACAALFLDYNLDGRLDIYLGNYFDEFNLWNLSTTRIMHDSFEKSRNAGPNFLYRQEPDGTFTEVGAQAGVDDRGWTLAVGSADIDNDGWPDIYSADDFGPDQLFLNARDGTFRNVSESVIGIDTKKGMNVDFGDFDHDGWLDIFVTNITTAEYLQEGNMLWHNNGVDENGRLSFIDVSLETGTYDGGWGWGGKFFDADNDADLDIIAVNGFISAGEGNYWYDLASWTVQDTDPTNAGNWPAIGDRSFSGYERTRFWRNDGLQNFTERAVELGINDLHDGRGIACFDYDNDGDLDVYVANQDQPPNFYRNNGVPGNNWLMVTLEPDSKGTSSRDGIGTRVTVITDRGRQIRERDGGNSYSGQSDPRLHFGLGKQSSVKSIEVRWPDGGLQYVDNVAAGQVVTVRQNSSAYANRRDTSAPAQSARPTHVTTVAESAPPPREKEQSLSELETQLKEKHTFTLASRYRSLCAASKQHDRSIDFFKKLCESRPTDVNPRIDLSCAYVDKIITCGGMAAIVSKGRLARQGLDEINRVIEKKPDLWAGYYCRAMNHLHWPRALLHSDDAVADFQKCLELQKARGVDPPPAHYERTYVGLGDGLAKAKRYDDARRAWQDGLKLFGASAALKTRLAITDNGALLKFVEDQRSLERPVDTDLSFLDLPEK